MSMTEREKLRWFWVTGVLPGSIYDDLENTRAQRQHAVRRPRRHNGRRNENR